MVAHVTKISKKMKKKSLLSIEKTTIDWEKVPHYNYEEMFYFRNFASLNRKYKKLFSFTLMFEKFSLKKEVFDFQAFQIPS